MQPLAVEPSTTAMPDFTSMDLDSLDCEAETNLSANASNSLHGLLEDNESDLLDSETDLSNRVSKKAVTRKSPANHLTMQRWTLCW